MIFVDSCDASKDIPWEIHISSSCSTSSRSENIPPKSVSIHSLLMAQDWEAALSLAEDDPCHAQEWFYGVEDHLDPTIDDIPREGAVVWKRLAIHLACVYRAPVGLVEVLVQAHPKGAISPDPHSGSLPLHLACQHGASFRVLRALLIHAPASTKAVDHCGRLAMHHAVLAKAHYAIIELLVKADAQAVLAVDQNQHTPLDLARESYGKRNVIVRLLEMVTLVLQKPSITTTPSPSLETIESMDTVCF